MEEYFFSDVDLLIEHLFSVKPDTSPLRLHKSLYFLFAYYGASYGSISQEDVDSPVSECDKMYPRYLFPAKFEASKYGALLPLVANKHKSGLYQACPILELEYDADVLLYVSELITQLLKASDFSLVERNHQDDSWKSAYNTGIEGQSCVIDNESLIREYKEKYFK